MNHRVHPAQRVAERGRVGQIAERDLHPHALVAQAARIAHQAADRLAGRGEPAQQRRAHGSGRAGQQDHRPTTTTRQGERSLRWTATSSNPAASIQARISDGLKLRLWLHA